MKKLSLLFSVVFLVAWVASNAQNYNVTFQVDMTVQIAKGAFDPAADKIQVRGSFNEWGTTDMTPTAEGSKVYAATISVPAGIIKYKFFFKHGTTETWESGDDKAYTVSANATLPVVLFNNEAMPSGANAQVTFITDMRLPLKQKDLVKATGKVFAAGSFNGWSTTATELKDADGDSLYSALVDTVKSGQLINYKFLYTNKSGGTTWEKDPNKTAWIVDGAQEVKRFFDDVNPNVTLKDGAISFYVNMSVLEELGVYNAAVDGLQVRGAFNGWSDSDKDRSVMNQDPLVPTSWFLSVPFVLGEVNSVQEYKFYVTLKDPGIWTDGWERPLSMGGGNRRVIFKGEPNQEGVDTYYDDVFSGLVIPGGKEISIKFRVDMKDAFDPAKIAIPMKVGDKVWWISEQPLFTRMMGWVDKDEMTNVELTDPDGDKIYEGTVTVKSPGFNAFEYRYGIQRTTGDNSFKLETAGFAKNAYRVRYIAQPSPRVFVQPYNAPLDKWTDKEDKSDQVEKAPDAVTDVKEIDLGIPTTFNLEQNYPNPFNPSTTIRFTLPKDALVSLKVYNVLGQEVATLLNKEMKAGSYNVDFNASNLSSGVYFYRIETSGFNVTKKMLLLK